MLRRGLQENRRPGRILIGTALLVAAAATVVLVPPSAAHERYNDGCNACHGAFTSGTSPQGTIFPNNNKHTMHRSSSYMNTECALCHTSGDGDDPFIGSSNGTASTPGLGCTGCHGHVYGGAIGSSGAGLRRHHLNSGITLCMGCHPDDPEPLPESIWPAYYGSPDTNAFDPCNAPPLFAENWSVGDSLGLDNDGDLLYDGDDPDCNCPADTNGDGMVNVQDLVNVILCWGGDGVHCPDTGQRSDVTGDFAVDVEDIVDVILAWGICA